MAKYFVESNKEDKGNKQNNLSDRTCGKCITVFKFSCHLERHLNSKHKCKPRQNIIENICQNCNIELSSKYNLVRHKKTCKNNNAENYEQINNTEIPHVNEEDNNIINKKNLLNIISKNQEIITNNPLLSNTQDVIKQNNKLIEILSKLV